MVKIKTVVIYIRPIYYINLLYTYIKILIPGDLVTEIQKNISYIYTTKNCLKIRFSIH